MAPASTHKASIKGAKEEDEASQYSKTSMLDASRVNDLIENVDNRLAGGLHGDFYMTGSKLDDKHRHGQLQEMFSLRKELSKIKGQLQKQNQHAEAEQTKASKGAPQANRKMTATIKAVVQQELSEKLRDLSVRNDRLESSLKKADVRAAALETKNKTLETKLKKAEERIQSLQGRMSDARVESLERKVNSVGVDAAHIYAKLLEAERLDVVREWQRRNRSPVEESTLVDNVRLQPYVFQHAEDIEWHTKRLDDLEERVKCRALR